MVEISFIFFKKTQHNNNSSLQQTKLETRHSPNVSELRLRFVDWRRARHLAAE
jgi:hypothetical protein